MGDDTPVRQVGDQEDPIALASVPFPLPRAPILSTDFSIPHSGEGTVDTVKEAPSSVHPPLHTPSFTEMCYSIQK